MFIDSLKCNLSKEKALKNGDKVTATLKYDEAIAKQLKLSFKNTEKEINVSGLEKGKEIDVFKDIQVSYTGTSPDGNVSIINKSSDPFVSQVTFSPSKDRVANNDKITLEAVYDDQEAIVQKVIVKEGSKEYTVSGLPEYLLKSSQLSEDTSDQLNKLVEKSIYSSIPQGAAFFINHIPNRTTSEMYTLADEYSCKNIVAEKAYVVTSKESSTTFYTPFKHSQYWVISSVDMYVNNKKEGTIYIDTKLSDVILANGKADSSSVESTRLDSLDKAQQYIEESCSPYNIEQISKK